MTRVIVVDPERPDADAIEAAAEVIRRGGLVAFPTETVYGLGAHALDAQAVQRIFAAKGRPATDPLIVHLAHIGQLGRVARATGAVAPGWCHP
jgi:L-threonylcarbamoyladenylate synthase